MLRVMFYGGKMIVWIKCIQGRWFQNHTRHKYDHCCSCTCQLWNSGKIDYKRHFAAIQPPFECFAMLQWHAAIWCDANTAACCPEQFPAFPSTDLRHASQAVWPQIAWTLSTTQAVLALLSASVTIFLPQFLLWSFPVQPLNTHSNLI